jgi:HAD superfamily hydrolase (TIGR01549 family)
VFICVHLWFSFPMIQAVSLDVAWTLIYPRESMWEIFADVARQAGADVTAEQGETLVHSLMQAHRERAIAEVEAGTEYSDSDEEFMAQFGLLGRLIFAAAGVPGDHGELAARFMARFWTLENWALFPDVIDGLKRLRAHGIRTGVLSNASSDLMAMLDVVGVLPHLDFTVISAIEGTRKPDQRIYARALERAAVPADQLVHAGDMYVEDILGPRTVGLRALLMDRGAQSMFPHHPESETHAPGTIEVVRNFDELLPAIGVA